MPRDLRICPPSVGSLRSSSATATAKPMLVTGLPLSVSSILDELTPITSPFAVDERTAAVARV